MRAKEIAVRLGLTAPDIDIHPVQHGSHIREPKGETPGLMTRYTSEQISGAMRTFFSVGEAVDEGIYWSLREASRDRDEAYARDMSEQAWKTRFSDHSLDNFCHDHQDRNRALKRESILLVYPAPMDFFVDLSQALNGAYKHHLQAFFGVARASFSVEDITPGWQALLAEFGAYVGLGYKCAQVYKLLRDQPTVYHSVGRIEEFIHSTVNDLTFHGQPRDNYITHCPAHVVIPERVLFAAAINFTLYDNNPESPFISLFNPQKNGFRTHNELAYAYEAQIQT